MKKVRSQKSEVRSLKNILLIALIMFLGMIITGTTVQAELTIKANDDHIKIDFFYHGSTVSVAGDADSGTDLIIKIASADGHEVLKQKGKVAGFLWMNTGTLNLEKVPNLYSIYSTKNIEDILNADEMDKYVIGYPALNRHIEINPALNEIERSKWFNEFVKYKESSDLYKTSSGKITTSSKDGKQAYYILTAWPYQAPPGDYLVTVYEVKDKKIIEKAETNVSVEQVGIVKTLASMAKSKAALYGIISIVAALAAGFGVGLIFRKGGGAH